jgi:hypothetical protein
MSELEPIMTTNYPVKSLVLDIVSDYLLTTFREIYNLRIFIVIIYGNYFKFDSPLIKYLSKNID